jgi:hypothetical protein
LALSSQPAICGWRAIVEYMIRAAMMMSGAGERQAVDSMRYREKESTGVR